MKTPQKEFEYLGLTFKPLRELKGKDADFNDISNYITLSGKTPKNWNYEEFYELAKKNGAARIDIFLIDNKEMIPASSCLFYYTKNQN